MDWIQLVLDLVVAATTIGALLFAASEIKENSKIAGQAHAREAWLRYLDLGFQNPQYGSTQLALRHLKMDEVEELWSKESNETEKYWWFLDTMMEACESLINYFPEQEWRNTIKFNLGLHVESLQMIWAEERDFYSESLREFVREAMSEYEEGEKA